MASSIVSDPYGHGPFVPADELLQAVRGNLLNPEEARLVYWGQFPQLRQAAVNTPPAVK